MAEPISREDRIHGGLLGAVVGDALGLPCEGAPRQWLDRQPVEGMTGGGPHGRPRGAWSDDASLTLCLAESLCSGYDLERVGRHFLAWWQEARWTPFGRTFGFGHTVAAGMHKMMVGFPAREAGQAGEGSNGNGSLMRTLPIALYFAGDEDWMLEAAHEASAITHAHPRSMMCCGIYCLLAAGLLEGAGREDALEHALRHALHCYRRPPWDKELPHLGTVLSGDVADLHRFQVRSGGYVVETLEGALWSFMRAESFEHALLIAVNLGGDTDTIGCINGGLAGVHFGAEAIPEDWLMALPRLAEVAELCEQFADAVLERRRRPSAD
jgi:ADP-ribosylglycohydrolase